MNLVEVKTSELVGAALDWMTAKASGRIPLDTPLNTPPVRPGERCVVKDIILSEPGKLPFRYSPSTMWYQSGPLIEDHAIFLLPRSNTTGWDAYIELDTAYDCWDFSADGYGPTPLIAAMRCLVVAKLGDTVQVPEELLP